MTTDTIAGRILIVEDDAGLAQVISGALGRAGNVVERADSGLTGAQWLQENEYDVVLLDMAFPSSMAGRFCILSKGRLRHR